MRLFLKSIIIAMMLASFGFSANEYKLNKAECEKYIKLSRQEVENSNLSLARAYAKKAIQANAWSKLAWANYEDIIQKLADEGEIPDYGTAIEESESNDTPKPSDEAEQFEGC